MPKENLIPIENKKPFETVQEVKNEVPSFEEFMKGYEEDESLNYDDLSGSGLGEVRGYGPCSGCSSSNTFKLEIILRNFHGGWKSMTVHNINDAREEAGKIIKEKGHWEDDFWGVGTFSVEKRRRLVNRINDAIDEHINYGKKINKVVDGDEEKSSSEYDKNDDPSGCSVIM